MNILLTSLYFPLLILPSESFDNLALYRVNYPAEYQVDGRTDILTEDISCPPLRGTRTQSLASSKPFLIVSFVELKVKYLECSAVNKKLRRLCGARGRLIRQKDAECLLF